MKLMSKPISPRSQPDPALVAVLRRLRDERGISRETLAHEAGITVSSYGKIEAAESAPGWMTVRRLAQALEVSIVELSRLVEREER
jgi:transcriptional regulator with XRE-family HTH domain